MNDPKVATNKKSSKTLSLQGFDEVCDVYKRRAKGKHHDAVAKYISREWNVIKQNWGRNEWSGWAGHR